MKTKSTRDSQSIKMNETTEWLNGTVTFVEPGTWQHVTWSQYVTTGDNIPDWRLRILQGYDATTYLEGERRKITYVPGFAYAKRQHKFNGSIEEAQTVGPLVNSMIPFGSDPASISTVEANRKALTRFNAKTLEVNQTFNGGVFLGELGTTLRGIKRPASALFDGLGSYRREAKKLRSTIVKSKEHLRSLSRRNRRQAISSANKAIAGLWLEKQFHWEPLLNDIDDGLKTLADMSSSSERWRIISASASEVDATFVTGIDWSLGLSGAGQGTDVTKSVAHVRYKGAVGVEPRNSTLPSLSNVGLTLRNFVPTIWELVPYSFVADYFSNIGDVLNGWSSGGYNVRWCCRTIRRDRETFRLYEPERRGDTFFHTYLIQQTTRPRMVTNWTRVQRDSFTGPYTPSLTWDVPGMSQKWLNLGALFSARTLDRFL